MQKSGNQHSLIEKCSGISVMRAKTGPIVRYREQWPGGPYKGSALVLAAKPLQDYSYPCLHITEAKLTKT